MGEFVLKFDNNVVEHLGLKLYQNKPTRVIAEIVSNSWDADAHEVLVNMEMAEEDLAKRWIAVIDDGHGMNHEDLKSSFLVIGRHKTVPSVRPQGSRPFMGRKGIGKLAPFGIAKQVDVVTAGIAADTGGTEVTWLRFNLEDVLSHGPVGNYTPTEVFTGTSLDNVPASSDSTGQVQKWLDHIRRVSNPKRLGTMLLMQKPSLRKSISGAQLLESLGRRFTVTLRDTFHVKVNDQRVEQSVALPTFEYRIPPEGYEAVQVGGREVRFWAGFVKEAEWPQDQAGVGVYAHGKIAQDRPFTFGAKGHEIWSRYMYGVVEADWLDEFPEDLISTDRTSVNWDADEVRELYEWGGKKVGEWTRSFAKWRREKEKEENEKRLKEAQEKSTVPQVTQAEQDQIIQLLSQITPRMGKDEIAKTELLKAVSEAWVQKPMQKLVKDLWQELGETGKLAPEAFADVVKRLSAHGVPESLNLAIVFAQRAFALTKLHEYVHTGTETNLQRLIERFPWIIEPDAAVLTANQTLKTVADKYGQENSFSSGTRAPIGTSDRNRPDFVFLSSPEERDILVVELKSPTEDLTIENRRQLEDYLSYLEAIYPEARRSGILVGKNPGKKVKAEYNNFKVIEWSEVLRLSRARNLELLAAMLLQATSGAGGDSRAVDAIKLGGDDAKAMLSRLAEHHEDLRGLMKQFEPPATPADGAPKEEIKK